MAAKAQLVYSSAAEKSCYFLSVNQNLNVSHSSLFNHQFNERSFIGYLLLVRIVETQAIQKASIWWSTKGSSISSMILSKSHPPTNLSFPSVQWG